MEVLKSLDGFRRRMDALREAGARIGLVPTMGALHAGHRSLVARAAAECDHVAVTVFVNPLQFGDPDDIANYPRTLEADLQACREAGAGTVLVPSVEEMYPGWPDPVATTVSVSGVSRHWEGEHRPGHFDGVATVVAKLFSVTGPCRAYFGEKDFQQLAVVRRMVADLSLPVEVVGCPTLRQPDGLALSSRNVRLSPEERRAATVLWRALAAGRDAVAGGQVDPGEVREAMAAVVAAEPLATLEYAAVVDAAGLTVPASLAGTGPLRLLVAARLGPVRLIDNCAVAVPSPGGAGAGDGPGARRRLVAAPAGGHNPGSD